MTTPRKKPRPTYDRLVIHSLLPAPGWQNVYVSEAGEHFCTPVHALALVSRRTYDATTTARITLYGVQDEEEFREIVAVDYHPEEGWHVTEEDGNFCGLLPPPPDWTLADFEAANSCGHTPPAAAKETPDAALPSRL